MLVSLRRMCEYAFSVAKFSKYLRGSCLQFINYCLTSWKCYKHDQKHGYRTEDMIRNNAFARKQGFLFFFKPHFLEVSIWDRHVILLRDKGSSHRKHHSDCLFNYDRREKFGGEEFPVKGKHKQWKVMVAEAKCVVWVNEGRDFRILFPLLCRSHISYL